MVGGGGGGERAPASPLPAGLEPVLSFTQADRINTNVIPSEGGKKRCVGGRGGGEGVGK